MKKVILVFGILLLASSGSYAQTEFELDPSQSMLMTGKGKGQDGAINPYYGQDCMAIVSNMSDMEFSLRIQKKGEILKTIAIKGGEEKRIELLKDQELYIDTNDEKVKFTLDFEPMAKE